MKSDTKKNIWVLVSAVLLILADQASKTMVEGTLKESGRLSCTLLPGLLEFSYLENPAAAFGLFGDVIWLVVALSLVVAAGIIAALLIYKEHTIFSRIASALLLAGGIGNLIDRMTRGYVVDFIHVMFFDYIFNIADCCVTIGAICLVAHYIAIIRKEKLTAEPKT